ncbi:MAG TPA: CDP-alcohol phosphatidyltransferase family protein [Thermomicrobiales bacterium]
MPISLPNLLSLSRLLLVPALWIIAAAGEARAVGIGLVISGLTDILDGQIARRAGQASTFGSRIDAVADAAVNGSALGWLYLLRPDVLRDHHRILVPLAAVAIITIIAIGVRFRRLADLHLPSGRAMAVLGYLFLIVLFTFDTYVALLFYGMVVAAWITAAEALFIVCTRDRLDTPVTSPLASSLRARTGRPPAKSLP